MKSFIRIILPAVALASLALAIGFHASSALGVVAIPPEGGWPAPKDPDPTQEQSIKTQSDVSQNYYASLELSIDYTKPMLERPAYLERDWHEVMLKKKILLGSFDSKTLKNLDTSIDILNREVSDAIASALASDETIKSYSFKLHIWSKPDGWFSSKTDLGSMYFSVQRIQVHAQAYEKPGKLVLRITSDGNQITAKYVIPAALLPNSKPSEANTSTNSPSKF